jgi:hypothetical protein
MAILSKAELMDEGSRNIIKFIAALTAAILLIMAAWFVGKPRPPQPAPVAAEASKKPAEPVVEADTAAQPTTDQADAEATYDDGEEIAPISGEPVSEDPAAE